VGHCPDPLARALFDIEGVRVVLIHHQFVTVGKDPKAKWPAIKRRAKAAIQAQPPGQPADPPAPEPDAHA
jgi:hypothetical protein